MSAGHKPRNLVRRVVDSIVEARTREAQAKIDEYLARYESVTRSNWK